MEHPNGKGPERGDAPTPTFPYQRSDLARVEREVIAHGRYSVSAAAHQAFDAVRAVGPLVPLILVMWAWSAFCTAIAIRGIMLFGGGA